MAAKSEAEVLAEVLDRPPAERARIAAALIRSLDDDEGEDDPDADEAWDAELIRRMAEIDSGAVQPISLEEFEHHIAERRARRAAAREAGG
jgi:putative addiction module component (TIGR02574 family)